MKNGKLPQSIDAEKGLLSSILLAPVRVFEECLVNQITERHFHYPAHAELFTAAKDMREQLRPIDLISVTQFLEDNRILEEIGGAAYVTELFSFVPHPGNAAYYIAILKEKALARQAIEVGNRIVAAASDPGERNLSVKVREALESIALPEPSWGVLSSRRFDSKNPPERARAIYEISRQSIATPGNLVAVSAHIKSGKSAFIGGCIAASIGTDGDTLGIDSSNPNNHALLHFDTEQSPFDHHTLVKTALTRAGLQEEPAWLRSYCIADVPLEQRFNLLEHELREAKKAHEGIHSVLLDGAVDYIKDPNDPGEAFAAVAHLHRLAIEYSTTIFCVIHLNPAKPGDPGKTRGHFGSQLARKAESNIELSKDEDEITTIYTSSSRHAFISKQDGPRFKWDNSKMMHASCAPAREGQNEARKGEMSGLVDEIFNIPDYKGGLSWADVHGRIETLEGLKRTGARRRFDNIIKAALIRKNGAGLYVPNR